MFTGTDDEGCTLTRYDTSPLGLVGGCQVTFMAVELIATASKLVTDDGARVE